MLHDSDTSVVFTDPGLRHPGRGAAHEEGAKIDTIVVIGGSPADSPQGSVSYEDLIAAGEPVMPPEPEEDDPVILMYTGGTTGLPKGALLDQRAEVLNVYHVGLEIGLPETRRFLFQAPMFHAAVVAGIVGIPASGATSVSIPIFDPELVLDTVEGQKIDTTMMVPVMMSMLEQHPAFSPARLKCLRDRLRALSRSVAVSRTSPAPWVASATAMACAPSCMDVAGMCAARCRIRDCDKFRYVPKRPPAARRKLAPGRFPRGWDAGTERGRAMIYRGSRARRYATTTSRAASASAARAAMMPAR